MNSDVARHLRCPLCASELTEHDAGFGRALRCSKGHSFDIARQGYVSLHAGPARHSGDTAEMVAARAEFLGAGHFDFLAGAIAGTARSLCEHSAGGGAPLAVDAGAGSGNYLAAVLDALPDFAGLALDVSKAALRRAARAHPRAAGVLCDVWQRLPLADGAASLVLNVFAPRNGAEFRRVLRAEGVLIVATPTREHLAELVEALGLLTVGEDKSAAVAESLGERFEQIREERYERSLHLTHREVHSLVAMGPSAWHVDAAALAASIASLPEEVKVTASVQVAAYLPK